MINIVVYPFLRKERTMKFKKVLIANRGEIALRIIRTCREMDIEIVAVYSDVDKYSLHVKFADEAYSLGPPQPSESYLNIKKIIGIARKAKVQAIHPGYGFLAENSHFAKACENGGIIFIGPTSENLRMLGDKLEARRNVQNAGIPVIPGTLDEINNERDILKAANQIGYPVVIKAADGGGGKGIRIISSQKEIPSAFRLAKEEALSAFGSSRMYLEKYIEGARHIEFQILADNFGNVVHLGERECSIQRRFQKLIEETPSPALTEALRKKMANAAVKVAKAVKYCNAGTVEFLLSPDGNFYFLEVNTRLQVEHPVTEMVTGTDIVKHQLKIAMGERLAFSQKGGMDKLVCPCNVGTSIECRIYAEDPYNGFLPSTGTIRLHQLPSGAGIRVESSIFNGMEVLPYYDPLIGKLIVWGEDRRTAINRMRTALSEFRISGIKTTISFFERVFKDKKFIDGDISTKYVEKFMKKRIHTPIPSFKRGERGVSEVNRKIAAIIAVLATGRGTLQRAPTLREEYDHTLSPWVLATRQELGRVKRCNSILQEL
ncbi:MAG TPA: acetyl-CoA carboxylase biotin carboxylase subunit [Candidatus Brocadiia bacterium]|nr:acetyl-CoA carboxylase biotin carboxylase subunit [Candidatus Brocadiales bacterium]